MMRASQDSTISSVYPAQAQNLVHREWPDAHSLTALLIPLIAAEHLDEIISRLDDEADVAGTIRY